MKRRHKLSQDSARRAALRRGAAARRGLTGLALLLVACAGRAAAAQEIEAGTAPGDAAGLLNDAYRRKAAHDADGAVAAFTAARAAGADPQRVSLELGYLAAGRGDITGARAHYQSAARGPDEALSRRAVAEERLLPGPFSADLYADAYAWKRASGAERSVDLVPTLRIRGLFRPVPSLDLSLYAFAQVTRDLASRGRGGSGLPEIYADDYALTGLGVLARFWQRRIGVFAQAGPALNLLDDGRKRVAFEARGGAFFGAESSRCAPAPSGSAALVFIPCLEGYAEAVYVSRFDHNLIGFGRARAAASYLVAGPVAFQLLLEGRAAKDRNNDFYNNFVDAGGAHRLRLLRPLRLDLSLGLYAGSYLGLSNQSPAPRPLGYIDLRAQAGTYVEF